MIRTRTLLLAAGTAAVLGTGTAVAVAAPGATPGPAATSAAPGATTKHDAVGHGRGHGHEKALLRALRRTLHSEATVPGGKDATPRTLGTQRGTVSAASPTSVTLHSTDGFDRTYVIGTATKVRSAGKAATPTAITAGAQAGAVAEKVGDSWQLRLLVLRPR